MASPIVIVAYDPAWPEVFQLIRARLAAGLGDLALGIEHVGSTSVPGLAAKPIIDIDMVIASDAELPAAISRLAAIGYVHEGDLGISGRHAFKPPEGLPRHHPYVCAVGNKELGRHLAFRDHLRGDPGEVVAYAALKRDLAERFGSDRDGYSVAKTAFVEEVLRRAAGQSKGECSAWRLDRPPDLPQAVPDMAVYTDITDEELSLLLADFDLGAPQAFKGIAEGVENSNFLLETDKGRFFLTIYEKRVRADELPFFLNLLTWLAEHGYPSAAPVANRAGEVLQTVRGKPAAIVTFLPGLSVRRPNAAHCREAGEGLARLHLAAEGYPGARANDLGQDAWAPMFERLHGAAEDLKPGLATQIQGDLDRIAARWPTDLPQGIVHADYFPDNVFFNAGQFAGTIDFYFACVDALAYDIAVALNAWCFEADGSFNITSARALVAGYELHRPLTDAERAALPVLAHGAAMRFFLTRLADWGATPAGALVRPKDPLEYERKLAVHREASDLVLFGEPS